MLKRGRILAWPALGMILAGFAFVLLRNPAQPSSGFQRLPDGSWLKIGGVSYTNKPAFQNVGIVGWRRELARILPSGVAARLGWTMSGGGIRMGNLPGFTNLAVFTVCLPATNGSFSRVRLLVSDEEGNSCVVRYASGNMMSGTSSNQSLRVDAWMVPAFPRRGKTLDLHFFDFSPSDGQWKSAARFTIPNPLPGPYASWLPERLPASKSDGDLSVTLLSLKTGASSQDFSTNDIAVTQAGFEVSESDHTNSPWKPMDVEIWDATGNHWIPTEFTNRSRPNFVSFYDALWPGETAWKFRFEFARFSDFAPAELVHFNDLTAPSPSQTITLDRSTNIAGCKLQLIALTGDQVRQPGDLALSSVRDHSNISIRTDPKLPGYRLEVVRITDEIGREAEISPGIDLSRFGLSMTERVYGFKMPEGAKTLNFTFAFHKSRFVEFIVRPEFGGG